MCTENLLKDKRFEIKKKLKKIKLSLYIPRQSSVVRSDESVKSHRFIFIFSFCLFFWHIYLSEILTHIKIVYESGLLTLFKHILFKRTPLTSNFYFYNLCLSHIYLYFFTRLNKMLLTERIRRRVRNIWTTNLPLFVYKNSTLDNMQSLTDTEDLLVAFTERQII